MAKQKFYAVYWGKRTGVFDSWAETESYVKGYPDAQFEGFMTKQEACASFSAHYANVQAETKARRHAKFAAMRAKRK